jgi:hypothetical protein
MARLDAKWYNFSQRGQMWYHFWQDTGSKKITPSAGGGSRKKPKPVYYDNHDYRADRIKKEDDELMLILSEFIRECL